MVRIHCGMSVIQVYASEMMVVKLAGIHTISNTTWSNIAAAPLKPPPSARFKAPLRSNCIRGQSNITKIIWSFEDPYINILGVYPSLDEDGKHECSKDSPQYPPEPPALGAFGFALRRLKQCSLFMLISPLLARGGEQGRLLGVGARSRPGRRSCRRFARG